MRRFFFLFLFASLAFADEASVQFEQANQLYRNGDMKNAAIRYEQILSSGYENAALYFNLGNASFKTKNLSAAILNYERAHRLAPGDEDVAYNLRLANLRVIDKIDPIPTIFLVDWWRGFVNFFSADRWSVNAVALLWLVVLSWGILLLIRSFVLRRILFLAGTLALGISIVSFIAMTQRLRVEATEQQAIIFAQSASVKSAPDAQSTDLFVIHEGLKVDLLDTVGDWKKIRLADGKVGWLKAEEMNVI